MIVNLALAALAGTQVVSAFPWVVDHAPNGQFQRLQRRAQPGSAASCPNNPVHLGAAPYTAKYPYCGAKNGLKGNSSCPNNKVPADGDTAHQYVAPGPLDIRGPCPGLNTAANHNFLSHDGITNFTELIDMQQNMYGVGYDLATLLAVLGVGFDGDAVGTTKLSIGCDATSRTSVTGTGAELGLDGHDKFEGDSSLTRNDFFLANGDNYSFNKTLYSEMWSYCQSVSNGVCDQKAMAKYRYVRYQESLNTNGNFYFGPKSLLLYGAASFVYALFPSLGDKGVANKNQTDSFFINEQLPPNWFSRVTPYDLIQIGDEIGTLYNDYPVTFGANTGKPNTLVGFGTMGPAFGFGNGGTMSGAVCGLYLLATDNIPAEAGGGGAPLSNATIAWATTMLNPLFGTGALAALGCPLSFNNA